MNPTLNLIVLICACALPFSLWCQEWKVTVESPKTFDFYWDSKLDSSGNIWVCYDRKIFSVPGNAPDSHAGIAKITPEGQVAFDTIINDPLKEHVYNGVTLVPFGDTVFYIADTHSKDSGNVARTAFIDVLGFNQKGKLLFQTRDTTKDYYLSLYDLEAVYDGKDVVFYEKVWFPDTTYIAVDEIKYNASTGERKSDSRIWENSSGLRLEPFSVKKSPSGDYKIFIDYMKVNSWGPQNLDTCKIEYLLELTVRENNGAFEIIDSMVNYALEGGEFPLQVSVLKDGSRLYVGEGDPRWCWLAANGAGNWATLVDSNGNTIWNYFTPGPNYTAGSIRSATESIYDDSTIFATGSNQDYYPESFLLHINKETGEPEYEKTYFSQEELALHEILPVPGEDAFYLIGFKYFRDEPISWPILRQNIFVMKVDKWGNVLQTTSVSGHRGPGYNFAVHPNPGQQSFKITCTDCQQYSSYHIEVVNAQGIKIVQLPNHTLNEPISMLNFPAGFYYVNVLKEKSRISTLKWFKTE